MAPMRYKLLGRNDPTNIIKTVLNNRGIDNYEQYLSIQGSDDTAWENLNNIENAVELFMKHFELRNKIAILVDPDVDGVCSATIMYKYIRCIDEDYPIQLVVHENNKCHGLEEEDYQLDGDVRLFITPDAASNDINQHIRLSRLGIDVLCLDHHQVTADISQSPAIIVNNQNSIAYKNKDCCGATITLEFCRAVDAATWNDFASQFYDLAAVANVADDMSLKTLETRGIIVEGTANVQNKMLQAIISAQEFSMKGIVSPFTIAFYVAPIINAFLRLATKEERELLMDGFIENESQTFEYVKRNKEIVEEDIYEHMVRLMKSYKGKQDRVRDKALKQLFIMADEQSVNKVVIIDVSDILEQAYTGLVAIKLSDYINRPVLLVRQMESGDKFGGSGRAFDNCPITDFRALAEQCPYISLAQGHPSAFGVHVDDINAAISWFNNELKSIDMTREYLVDFDVKSDDVWMRWCLDVEQYKTVFAHGVSAPLWLIRDVVVKGDGAKVVGKSSDTVQFYNDETGVQFVKFKCDEDDELLNAIRNNWDKNDFKINIIGKLGINTYNEEPEAQVIIVDYELQGDNR